jgi:hypothetical protein
MAFLAPEDSTPNQHNLLSKPKKSDRPDERSMLDFMRVCVWFQNNVRPKQRSSLRFLALNGEAVIPVR